MALGQACLVTRKDGTLRVSIYGVGVRRKLDYAQVRLMLESGDKVVVIAHRFGVTKQAVSYARRQLGFPPRLSHRPRNASPSG